MDLQNIIADRASAVAKFMGEELAFRYRPGLLTPDLFDRIQNGMSQDELGELYATILVDWDLTKNGREVPITAESVKQVPIQLLRAIMTAIMEDVPQGEAVKRSNAG